MLEKLALLLAIAGGINWGLVGLLQLDLDGGQLLPYRLLPGGHLLLGNTNRLPGIVQDFAKIGLKQGFKLSHNDLLKSYLGKFYQCRRSTPRWYTADFAGKNKKRLEYGDYTHKIEYFDTRTARFPSLL